MSTQTMMVEVDARMHARIARLAEFKSQTADRVVGEAIARYVECEEKRQAFKRDALQAWQEYQETGLHLTGAEMDAWLARLEAGENAPMPVCHR